MIVMNKEIYEDLFKNVVINGHYPFEKLNEIKNYIKTLNTKIENLEQQCKKQKEVIDKAIEYINGNKDKYYQDWGQDDGDHDIYLSEYEIKELLDILKRCQNDKK